MCSYVQVELVGHGQRGLTATAFDGAMVCELCYDIDVPFLAATEAKDSIGKVAAHVQAEITIARLFDRHLQNVSPYDTKEDRSIS